MGPHYLDRFFTPRSIAVIGASERPDSVGMRVFRNLLDAGFGGALYAVNPNHEQVQGHPSYRTVEAIGKPVDLAVIATPAATVPARRRFSPDRPTGTGPIITPSTYATASARNGSAGRA